MQYGGLTGAAGGASLHRQQHLRGARKPGQPAADHGQRQRHPARPASCIWQVPAPPGHRPRCCRAGRPIASANTCNGAIGAAISTANPTDAGGSRIDRGHINTWVAGVPTPLNDLNYPDEPIATGTYTGHAIGSVFNNGQSYVAAGGFTGSYNFGTQTGTMAVSNFDGRNFAASGRAPLNGAKYSFGVNSPGATGTINGTFYGPMAAETGGNFAVQTHRRPGLPRLRDLRRQEVSVDLGRPQCARRNPVRHPPSCGPVQGISDR